MKRVVLILILPLTLLTVALILLGQRYPTSAEDTTLSATVLSPAEGNALMLRSDGEKMLVCVGSQDEMTKLGRYLRDSGETKINLLCLTSEAQSADVLTESADIRQALNPAALNGAAVKLGQVRCSFSGTQTDLSLTVEYGERTLAFVLDRQTGAVALRTEEGTVQIDTASHSVGILCDADGITLRPDYRLLIK